MPTANRSSRQLIGVVLAGGQSRRMGRDKALLMFRGRTLLDHMLVRLAEAGITDCVVSGQREGWRHVPDRMPGLGPVAGLHALAEAFPGARLLVVPVDMPMLPAQWLRALGSARPDAAGLHFGGHPLPLRLDADAKARAEIERLLADESGSERSLLRLLAAIDAETYASPDHDQEALAFTNANNPADWEALAP